MTYDYGRRDAARGQGEPEPRGQWKVSPGADTSRHGNVPPQRTGVQHDDVPHTPGYGGPQAPQGRQAGPPTGFGVPSQRPAMRADVDQRTPPYRGGNTYGRPGEYATPALRGPEKRSPEPEVKGRSRKPLVLLLLVVLAAGGGGGWYYLQGSASQAPTEQERRVADRTADPAPLTATEVFRSGTVVGAGGSYKVLKTQESEKCDTAASGGVAQELAAAGCTQVVRATLASSDNALVATAGIFNLESRTKTEKAAAAIKEAVDKGTGRFGGLVAGGSSDVVNRAAANLAWEVRGHYLLYCIVAKADGSAITEDDPRAEAIRTDLVEKYLGGVVIVNRETAGGSTAFPSTRPS
ncbi:hypothetical protein [Actinoplanes sp. NPDC049118]|uniref:hypothetical protein n=1 Tax=Actinoplanes sp. NPDC049118 TaxID=3155769 RepID=UPI0033FFBF56